MVYGLGFMVQGLGLRVTDRSRGASGAGDPARPAATRTCRGNMSQGFDCLICVLYGLDCLKMLTVFYVSYMAVTVLYVPCSLSGSICGGGSCEASRDTYLFVRKEIWTPK